MQFVVYNLICTVLVKLVHINRWDPVEDYWTK